MTYEQFIQQLNQDMRAALKAHDSIRVSALRSLLARIANAEAVPLSTNNDPNTPAEVPRKQLSYGDAQELLKAELAEINAAINQFGEQSNDYKGELVQKLKILQSYLSVLP